MPLTLLTTAAEVLVAAGHDPFVRSSLQHPEVSGWAGHQAVAWLAIDERVAYLMSLGEPPSVAQLVTDLLPELVDGQRVTLPRGTAALLPAWVALEGLDWDFRWIDAAPPWQAAEDRVVEVDDAEVAAMLPVASPNALAQPGDPAVRAWLGVRGPDGLLACVADTSATDTVGCLSSVAVHPSGRGQGLGSAVSAAMLRRLLAQGCDLVWLGMYADNIAARAVYDALGMHDDHRFTSGPLQIRSRW